LFPSPNVLDPLEFAGSFRPLPKPGETVLALLLVKQAGYVPAGVTPRARIDDRLFTCSFQGETLPALRQDTLIQTIALSAPSRLPDAGDRGASRQRHFRQCLDHLAQVVAQECEQLSPQDRHVLREWLPGRAFEAVARKTGMPVPAVRDLTRRFRYRPAVWSAVQQVREATGNADLSSLVGVLDLRGLEALLLDDREEA